MCLARFDNLLTSSLDRPDHCKTALHFLEQEWLDSFAGRLIKLFQLQHAREIYALLYQ